MNTSFTTPLPWPVRIESANTARLTGKRAYGPAKRSKSVSLHYHQLDSATIDVYVLETATESLTMNTSIRAIAKFGEAALNDPALEKELAALPQAELEAAILATRGLWAERADLDDILGWRRENDGLDEMFAWKFRGKVDGEHASNNDTEPAF